MFVDKKIGKYLLRVYFNKESWFFFFAKEKKKNFNLVLKVNK